MSDRQAARDQIGTTYQTASNDLAVQYERNRRNLNEQAAARGLNTGTASQQQLALNQQWQRNYGALRGREAADVAEADRGIQDLKTAYQNQVQQAISANDYERAAALMDEYKQSYQRMVQRAETQAKYGDFSAYATVYGQDAADKMASEWNYQRNMQEAQQKAQWGDFSGYAQLYGPETAQQMQALWNAQNPDLAYQTGRISAAQYAGLTGKYPAGYSNNSGYRPSGGLPKTSPADPETPVTEEPDASGNPYADNPIYQQAVLMTNSGASANDVQSYLRAMYESGRISASDYTAISKDSGMATTRANQAAAARDQANPTGGAHYTMNGHDVYETDHSTTVSQKDAFGNTYYVQQNKDTGETKTIGKLTLGGALDKWQSEFEKKNGSTPVYTNY